MNEQETLAQAATATVSRRRFFGYAGALAGAGMLASGLAGCTKDEDPLEGAIDLGGGDIGILNYAYALEQLEAAFYTQVVLKPFTGMTADEKQYFTEIRDHEITHREVFRKALSAGAIPDLTPDFSTIDFAKRTSVLTAAKAFEDLGVSAYNGAGKLLTQAPFLALAGKIVSVEARHAAAIRDMIAMGTFADSTVIDDKGLDASRSPDEVLAIAGLYIKEKLNTKNLPTS